MIEEIIQYVFLLLAYKSIFFCFIKEKFLEEFFISVFSYMLIKRLLHFYKTPNYIDKKEFLKVFCILPEFRILKITATFYLAFCKLIRAFKFCIFKGCIAFKSVMLKVCCFQEVSIFEICKFMKCVLFKYAFFFKSWVFKVYLTLNSKPSLILSLLNQRIK